MHRQVNQPLPKGELSIQHDAILKILCGADWRNRMILAHNYREEAGPGISSESLQKHEDELRVGFWKHVTMGDNIQRFDFHDQRKSAWKILWPLMKGASNDLENKLVSSTTGASGYGRIRLTFSSSFPGHGDQESDRSGGAPDGPLTRHLRGTPRS